MIREAGRDVTAVGTGLLNLNFRISKPFIFELQVTIAHIHNQQFVALVSLIFDLCFSFLILIMHISKKNVDTKLEDCTVIRS